MTRVTTILRVACHRLVHGLCKIGHLDGPTHVIYLVTAAGAFHDYHSVAASVAAVVAILALLSAHLHGG
jgi:hypothetical protein